MAVEEDKTGIFSVMGGYSRTDGLSATVTVGDANFLGTGDIAKASATVGQYTRGFDLSLTDPYALGPHVSLGGDLFGKETFASSYQSYNSTFYGAKIVTAAPLTEQLGMSWSYSIYNQNLSLPSGATASLPIQQAAAAGPMWVSSVGTGMTYSTLDNPKSPTGGVRVQTNNEFAGLGGAAKFARTTEDARYYHEIFGDVTGMVRGQGGYVSPWGGQQLPLLSGFFGGPQLVRGFAPNGFGPRVVTPGDAGQHRRQCLLDDDGRTASADAVHHRRRALENGAVLRRRQSVGDQRVERVRAWRHCRRRSRSPIRARSAPRSARSLIWDSPFGRAAGRLRLSDREAKLRRDPAAEFLRRGVLRHNPVSISRAQCNTKCCVADPGS